MATQKEDLDWDRGLITNGKGQKDRLVSFSPLGQEAIKRFLHLRTHYSDPLLWVSRAVITSVIIPSGAI